MPRKATITNEQILVAARDCFQESGLNVTTAEIARRAGVSEGSIFRRFPTKTDLFHAAMALEEPEWFSLLDELVGQGDLEENLTRLFLAMLDDFERVVRRFAMVMAINPSERRVWSGDEMPIRVMKKLATFFERERQAGRIRGADPELLARFLMGSVHHFTFAELHGLNAFFAMPQRTYARGVVRTLLDGIRPEDNTAEIER